MEIKIFWSEVAENQIRDIFDYYSFVANPKVADKIVDKILIRVELLRSNSKIGKIEELLEHYPQKFRYIIEGNYKIIYFIDKNVIIISSVFDCRQSPEKLKNTK